MSFDFEKFADAIENDLKGNSVGYAFVVSFKNERKAKRAGGLARTRHNPPETPMSIEVPFHTASVSKTISAVALLKLLNKREDVSLESDMYPFLPDHWKVHHTLKDISFTDLLTHTSGLRTNALDYHDLKRLMEHGVSAGASKSYHYLGTNYALMRLLIPRLAKCPIPQDAHGGSSFDVIQASAYAQFYIDYVNKELFAKAGLPALNCSALPYVSGVCYHFPDHGKSGTDFGDQTLTCGSRGWVISVAQLAKFFRAVHHTENILPVWLSKKMRDDLLGYDAHGTTAKGVKFFSKGGYFPGDRNPGELHALTMGFQNDVHVEMIINSERSGGKKMVDICSDCHDKAFIKLEV